MQDKIPLPTDNIFKFYALFGMLLVIFSFASTIYINKTTNELLFSSIVEAEILQALEHPSTIDKTKKELITKKINNAISDKKFYLNSLGMLAGLGFISMIYGFKKWHQEIQPIQDEISKLTLEKLRHEIKSLKKSSHE